MPKKNKTIVVECKKCSHQQQEHSTGRFWKCLYCGKLGNKEKDYWGDAI